MYDILSFSLSPLLSLWEDVRVVEMCPFLNFCSVIRYLHEVCLPSVVHRNFKSANILLDEELNPHLSDCGLAALTPNTERQVINWNRILFSHFMGLALYVFFLIC